MNQESVTTRRKLKLVAGALCLASVLAGTVALAANPQFLGPVFLTNQGIQLKAVGTIVGVGNKNLDIKFEAKGTASVECINPAGRRAPGQDADVDVSGEKTNLEVKNGRVDFVVATEPPGPLNPVRVCPNRHWTPIVIAVRFHSAKLTVFQPAGTGKVVLRQSF